MTQYQIYDSVRIAHNKWIATSDELIQAHRNLWKPYTLYNY